MDDLGIRKGVQESDEMDNDPFVFGERPEKAALSEWQTQVLNPRLQEFFADLHRFTFLENLTFQAMQGTENNGNPVEKYLMAPTMRSLFNSLSLSTGLKRLTLDVCCEIDSYGDDFHTCELLSRVLPRVEVVRLRLTRICPLVFKLGSDIRASDVRLRNLVVKLHLPRYPKCSIQPAHIAQMCDQNGLNEAGPVSQRKCDGFARPDKSEANSLFLARCRRYDSCCERIPRGYRSGPMGEYFG